ncbi:MAG TPA: long-chain fatty acid--CoA ligase [Chloroflexota bacterium]|nr:long-chain fatty acid--CoA ligase [Chloroflexota bacterium]
MHDAHARVPRHPWWGAYDQGVPYELDIPDEPLHTALTTAAGLHPQRAAIRFFGRSISYRELEALANRFANALIALGVQPGDRVALLMPNCPQMVLAYYGALRAGAVLVPTSPLYSASELEHQLADAEASVVVCLSALFGQVQTVRPRLPALKHVIVTNIKDFFPTGLRLLFTLSKERKDGHRVSLPSDGQTYWLTRLLDRARTTDPAIAVSADDLALLQYTGGTTGLAKGAMLSHRNLVANALQVRAWFSGLANPDGSDIVMGVLPLFHIYGMTTVMNFSIFGGGTMVLQPKFVVEDVLKGIHREKPQLLPGVPTMYLAINHAPNLQHYGLRSLKGAISGAAPLPREVQTQFQQLTGARLVEGYGLTEASPVTHCVPLGGPPRIGSIGVPLPGTAAAIFDQETGQRQLAPGEIGELAVRGPQVMQGYWRRPEETANVLRDGWLFTGDIASVAEDGYFTIVDRKKDMIISGGMNVYPRDVEEPLFAHPKVKEAVAVGIPDDRWGEAVKVYIVLRDGQSATEQEMIDYCHARMARYKVPKFVEFRADLPKSMVGKVLRRQLLQEELARQTTSRAS